MPDVSRRPRSRAEFHRRREQNLQSSLANHPSRLRAERERLEREREFERRAATPDPRATLRAAHQLRAEALTEVARVEGLHDLARSLVAELEQQHRRLSEALRAGIRQGGERLVEALAAGAEQLPTSPRTDPTQIQVEAVAGRLGVAREAVQQLGEQLERAHRGLAAAERSVSAAVVLMAVAHAVGEAEDIAAIDATLYQRRRSLWSLSASIHFEQRRLGEPGSIPPSVARAVGAAADTEVDPAWGTKLNQLRKDAEAELD